MKKSLIFLLFSSVCFCLMADSRAIILSPGGHQHNHSEYYPTADMPLGVYYDDDTDEIVIIADGFSSYYDVVIEDYYTGVVVISTQISGYGDSIDVSSLSTGTYTITITTSYNNVFVGQFTI